MDFKSFDWRSLNRYFSAQASNDLNAFLEKLPQTAGQTALVAAGIAWAMAGAIGLYTTVQVQNLTQIRTELAEAEALTPIVPTVRDVPVSPRELTDFVENLEKTYRGITIKQQGPAVSITASNTSRFTEFREAIGHIQNGGSGWRVSVEKLCVGRECPRDQLQALLRINRISVDRPS